MTGGIFRPYHGLLIAHEIKAAVISATTAEYKTHVLDFCFPTSEELFAFLDRMESKHTGIVEDTLKMFDYSRRSCVISDLLQTYDIRMISGVGRAFVPSCYDKLFDTDIPEASFNSTALHILRWMLYRPTDQRLENIIGDDGREQYEIGMKKLHQVELPHDVHVAMAQQLDVIFSLTFDRIQSRPWDCNVAIPLIIPHIQPSVELVVTPGSSIRSNDAVIDWYMDQMCEVCTKRVNAVADLPFPISLEYDKRYCSIYITV